MNGDFSTVKGLELKMELRRSNRIAMKLNYTFSSAQGTGSNPSSARWMIGISATEQPFFPNQIAPLDFNQTHRGYLNVDYRFEDNDGGVIFENFGLNLLVGFNSGFNYTKTVGTSYVIPSEPFNSSVMPWNFQIDIKADKSFFFGPLLFNVYLVIINIFNIQNVISVFPPSGDPYDDGYLSSEEGRAIVDGYTLHYGPEFGKLYQDLYKASIYDYGMYGTPRQIRLGFRLNY